MMRLLIITSAVAALGLLVAAWALCADCLRQRSRDQRRCPKCWYDMRSTPTLVCSECGHDAKKERRLHKFRRRWRWAAFWILVSASSVGVYVDRRYHPVNWLAVAPSFLLFELVEDMPLPSRLQINFLAPSAAPKWTMADEIWRRYEAGRLSTSQRAKVIEKQFDAGSCFISISTRDQWPAGVPIWVAFYADFAGPFARQLRATPRFPGGRTISLYRIGSYGGGSPALYEIGPHPGDTDQILFDFVVTEGETVIWQGTTTLKTAITGEVDDVMTPVLDGLEFDSVRTAIANSLAFSSDRERLTIDLPRAKAYTIALVIDITYGEETVASAELFLMAESSLPSTRYLSRVAKHRLRLTGDVARLRSANSGDPNWAVHIRGEGARAMRDLMSSRYWAGEFTLPIGQDRWK